ncbi:MAG: amidohydrolase family protein [Verrucomicrobiota bacterium]|nr:amidohydrolase family protein [Verrucomicrobiota bacterium]
MNLPQPLTHVWTYNERDDAFWKEHLEDFVPASIIDGHLHVFRTQDRIHEMTDAMRRQYWVGELVEPCDAVNTARCQAITFPGRTVRNVAFGFPDLDFAIDPANEYLRRECVARGWWCNCVTVPQWTTKELEARIAHPGIIGLKPYYTLIQRTPDSRDTFIEASIYDFLPRHHLEVAQRHKLWITLHVPKAGRLGHPDNIREIKEIRSDFPDIKLVIAHYGRCYTLAHAEESLPQLAGDDGLFFDSSAVVNPDVHTYALKTLGTSRIIYGTDNPIFYMRGRRAFAGRSYRNHTNHPFYFNKVREAPEIEANYTLFMYEELLALKQACQTLKLSQSAVQALFHDNCLNLINRK